MRDIEPRHEVEEQLPRQFKTDQGSVYVLGSDNRYSRFKTATGEQFPPATLTVFMKMPEPYNPWDEMPFLQAAQNKAGKRATEVVQFDPTTHELSYVRSPLDIIDPNELIVVAFNPLTDEPVAKADASLYPALGRQVYEELTGEHGSNVHVGNRVVEIKK